MRAFVKYSIAIAAMLAVSFNAAYSVQPLCTGDYICNYENEYCGTPYGTVSFCTGSSGLGICMEGNGYVIVGDEDRFTPTPSMPVIEVEFRVLFTHLPGPGDYGAGLVTKYLNDYPAQSEWGVYVEGNVGAPSWVLVGNGIYPTIRSNGGVEINTWYHVVAWICQNGYGSIWVDGTCVAGGPVIGNPNNTTTPVIVGNAASEENRFYGVIDEVRIGCLDPIGVEQSTWGAIKSLY